MFGINFNAIDKKFLQSLVEDKTEEDKTLEYKEQLPENLLKGKISDTDKRKLLAEISAFANTDGGILIFGVAESKGVPTALNGVTLTKEDVIKTRDKVLDYVRDNVQPPIFSIECRFVELSESQGAFLVNIPKSYNAPHKLKLKHTDAFYGRRSNGMYPMDVHELRTAFNLSEARIEKIRKFREDKVTQISNKWASKSPLPFDGKAAIVLHLIPFNSFEAGKRYDNISTFFRDFETLKPMFKGLAKSTGARVEVERRFNLDGILK